MNGGVAVVAVALDRAARLNITVTGLITNNPPSRPAIQTDKKYYYSGETITATASGSVDPDGDPVTYYYYKFYDLTSGTTLQDWNTSNTYTIGSSSEGHVIRVYARACDDKGACSSENSTDVGVIKVLTISPSDDAYVSRDDPDSNHGGESYLICGADIYEPTPLASTAQESEPQALPTITPPTTIPPPRYYYIYKSYIKFDLSEIPSNSVIFSANLFLYMSSGPSNVSVNVHRVTGGNWNESTITWNNAPSWNTQYTAQNRTLSTAGWMMWNVTSDVQGFVNRSYYNYGWCVRRDYELSTPPIYFHSKEYSNSPYLRVEYAPRI